MKNKKKATPQKPKKQVVKSCRGRRGGCLLISHEEGKTKINIKA